MQEPQHYGARWIILPQPEGSRDNNYASVQENVEQTHTLVWSFASINLQAAAIPRKIYQTKKSSSTKWMTMKMKKKGKESFYKYISILPS